MLTWLQQVGDEPGDVLPVFDRSVVVRRALGLPHSPKGVRRIREEELSRSVEIPRAGVKAARTYRTTASAAGQPEVQLRRWHRGCAARLTRDRRTAWALSGSALRDIHRRGVGVGFRVEAGRARFCRSCHFDTVANEPNGEASRPSIECRAPFTIILCCCGLQLRWEYGIANAL